MIKDKRKVKWEEMLTAILVGACVAFFTSLFQGLSDMLSGHGPAVIGGATTTATLITNRTLS